MTKRSATWIVLIFMSYQASSCLASTQPESQKRTDKPIQSLVRNSVESTSEPVPNRDRAMNFGTSAADNDSYVKQEVIHSALAAVPRSGAVLLDNTKTENYMTGPLQVMRIPYGSLINQTAATFNLGGFNGCVMGGAENGEDRGGLGAYSTIDTVTECVSNSAKPALFTKKGIFTVKSFTPEVPLSLGQLAKLQKGVKGRYAGTWLLAMDPSSHEAYASWITDYSSDGSSISVVGWWKLGKSGYMIPPSSAIVYFGANTKIWAGNKVVTLSADSTAVAATGEEMNLSNNKSENSEMVGYDVSSNGVHSIMKGAAFRARGSIQYGVEALTGRRAGYVFDPSLGRVPDPTEGGYVSRQGNGIAFLANPDISPAHTLRGFQTNQSKGWAFSAQPSFGHYSFEVKADNGETLIGFENGQVKITGNAKGTIIQAGSNAVPAFPLLVKEMGASRLTLGSGQGFTEIVERTTIDGALHLSKQLYLGNMSKSAILSLETPHEGEIANDTDDHMPVIYENGGWYPIMLGKVLH